MARLTISIVLFLVTALSSFSQMKFDDVTMPATFKAGTKELILNGAGIREKFFLDLYVGGLYLESKSTDPDAIISSDKASSIKLHIISGLIDSDKMTDAVDEGMEKSTKGNTSQFAKEIAAFKSAFAEEINVGDEYDIVYVPDAGTIIYKNSSRVSAIKGLEFKKAVFGIWLCDDPADDDLKEGMLEGK